ncbi:hypothetical protein MN116_003262 [Schistosoma mekongi]|uniref:Dynein light chain n=1 Tax=Schistosoma mekongi TaxID=38744 RepID=A0AAE1ZHF3_SCHME|nr:hypothetical protein MN116_003262 [Schistosoma mekongi]
MEDAKCFIKNSDLSEETKHLILDICIRGAEKYTIEKDIAGYIKKECDRHFKPRWQCIVGRSFGRQVFV